MATEVRLTPPTQGGRRRTRQLPVHVGRQSKLTPEVQKKVVDAVRAGAFLSVAAQFAGISQATLHGWLERGRNCPSRKHKDAIYLEFLEEISMAEAAGEVAANVQWRAAWSKDWHSAQKWLESRYPERYAPNRNDGSPTQAFAGVNINIGPNGTNIDGTTSNNAISTLEALIEKNPSLLTATSQLFDAIDALSNPDDEVNTYTAPNSTDLPQTSAVTRYEAPNTAPNGEIDPFDIIEGTYTPVESDSDD